MDESESPNPEPRRDEIGCLLPGSAIDNRRPDDPAGPSREPFGDECRTGLARDDQDGKGVRSAGNQSQHVERRFVRPMDVLKNEHGWGSAAKLVYECRRHFMRHHGAVDCVAEVAAG